MDNLDKKLTPLMKQYWDVKSAHQDKILFFRMGDFYELFDQDAVLVAPILGIALTARNKNHGDNTAMCGMPHHSVHNYINKLLSLNYKVAICDQIEDPKEAKGIVKRAVTRTLSPGMVYDPETLEATYSNYMAAYDEKYISFLESTTGETFFISYRNEGERKNLLDILNPSELVLSSEQFEKEIEQKKDLLRPCLTRHECDGKTQCLNSKEIPSSSQRLVSYAVAMQGASILNILEPFTERVLRKRVEISSQVIKHLEIFETYGGQKKGSLFHAINKTKSAAGARKLKNWILFPLTELQEIEFRQKEISVWQSDLSQLKKVRELMAGMGDIERRLGKLSNPSCNARDLISLRDSLAVGKSIFELSDKKKDVSLLRAMIEKISSTIREGAPLTTRSGHMICDGVSEELDYYISLSTRSQDLLAQMEARERESTGISSLKVRYNQVFGYYIEVTKVHSEKVPKHYVRKQTLTSAERYITDELHKLEVEILSAQTKRSELESFLFEELKNEILSSSSQLLHYSHLWSDIDVLTSLAWLALESSYVCPQFVKNNHLKLVGSRHPVVEQLVDFVSNDIEILPGSCLLLTGPNMAGKSTLMRQVALTAIMAQIGSFVPAKVAQVPVFESIFTRIGASDMMSEGLSTFMVEMKETAHMLKNANSQSLIVLDEIGRGTSTYDGMSLAQAILIYLVSNIRCLSLFATHYHELTQLSSTYVQIQNAHMKVGERMSSGTKELHFLYSLVSGPASKSYGIEVARLAGLPQEVVQMAKKILSTKEKQIEDTDLPLFVQTFSGETSLDLKDSKQQKLDALIQEIEGVLIAQTSPLDALNKIHKWQSSINDL